MKIAMVAAAALVAGVLGGAMVSGMRVKGELMDALADSLAAEASMDDHYAPAVDSHEPAEGASGTSGAGPSEVAPSEVDPSEVASAGAHATEVDLASGDATRADPAGAHVIGEDPSETETGGADTAGGEAGTHQGDGAEQGEDTESGSSAESDPPMSQPHPGAARTASKSSWEISSR